MSQDRSDYDQPTRQRSLAGEPVPGEGPAPRQGPTLKPRAVLEQRTPLPDLTQQHRPLPRSEPPEPHRSGLYVPWWGLVIVILAVAAITCGMWWAVFSSRGVGAEAGAASPTPIFMVITATPTLQGAGGEQPTGEVQPTAPPPTIEEQPTATATSAPAVPLAVGSRVAIAGTEGFGLRVRQGPGLGFDMIFLAYDGDEFTVEDGPREVDGFVWWYIVDPNDPNRFGWAAEEFMQVVP
jgi:hypothetical protein